MAFIIDKAGNTQHLQITPELYAEAKDQGLSIPALLNRKYPDVDASKGSAASQIFASEGLLVQDSKNPFGIRSASIAEILDGRSGHQAGPSNTKDQGSPFGTASRILFPAAVIAQVESAILKDRVTDGVVFNDMVATTITLDNENFEQPVLNYQGQGGPESAKAQRIAQLASPPAMLKITTSDRIRRLAAHGIGIEMSDQAMKATNLDLLVLTVTRFMQVELDDQVYSYIGSLFNGNNDLVNGAVSAVTTTSLDAAATGGVVTHRSWVKFLARNRKFRRITHCIADIDTYLKVEGRTGRPGSNNYDPTLSRIDPQAVAQNVGFGNDVKWFIVDDASAGGPVPANTVYALDSSQAFAKVVNTAAAYQASEAFVLKRSTAMRMDWAEDVFRMYGDSELRAFDVLTIA